MLLEMPIFLIIYFTSIFLIIFRFKFKSFFLILIPLIALIQLLNFHIGFELQFDSKIFNSTISIIKVDEISRYFGILFLYSLIITNLFSLNNSNKTEIIFSQIYAGSALGAILTNNLMVSFIFLEMMSLSATFLICATKERESLLAGFRYLFIHLFAGVILLIGILFYYKYNNNFIINKLELNSFYSYLILLGLGINAGFPLFHTWIPDAYSKASYSGTVYLSIFTTKTAIYLIFRIFQGADLLIVIGTVMSFFSIFYALIESDLRKILSYLLINQLGFLLVSIGLDNDLAYNSFYSLVFSHIVYDTILFMASGVILLTSKTVFLSELSNLYRKIPFIIMCYFIAALAISGFPGTSGYIGKTILFIALKENRDIVTYLMLLFSSAGIAFLTLFKIPNEIFFSSGDNNRVKVPMNINISLGILAYIIIIFGLIPQLFSVIAPAKITISLFKFDKIFEKIQFFSFIFLSYILLKKFNLIPLPKRAIYLDIDWFVRKPLYNLILLTDKIIYDLSSNFSSLISFANLRYFIPSLASKEEYDKVDSIGHAVLMSLIILFSFAVILIIK